MTDESEAARARRAPAPPPRQTVRPPEPRPRTQLPDNTVALLPAPPRLIRPSEHLAIVERSNMEKRQNAQQEHMQQLDRRPTMIQSQDAIVDRMERRQTGPDNYAIVERPVDRRPTNANVIAERPDRRAQENLVIAERRPQVQRPENHGMERAERRPPPLVPSVTVLHGPRPTLPPPVPVHRSVAPPPLRMPAPVPHPIMRLPQPRRDVQPKNSAPQITKLVKIKCPLCLKSIGKESASATKCGHVFCTSCLYKFLINVRIMRNVPICPVCATRLCRPGAHHLLYLSAFE